MCILSEGKIIHSSQTAVRRKKIIPSTLSKKAFTFSWVKAVQNINLVGKRKLKEEKILINISTSSKSLWNPAGFALFSSWTLNASAFGHKWTQNIKEDLLWKKPPKIHREQTYTNLPWWFHPETFSWMQEQPPCPSPGSRLGTCQTAARRGSCRQQLQAGRQAGEGSHSASGEFVCWTGAPFSTAPAGSLFCSGSCLQQGCLAARNKAVDNSEANTHRQRPRDLKFC